MKKYMKLLVVTLLFLVTACDGEEQEPLSLGESIRAAQTQTAQAPTQTAQAPTTVPPATPIPPMPTEDLDALLDGKMAALEETMRNERGTAVAQQSTTMRNVMATEIARSNEELKDELIALFHERYGTPPAKPALEFDDPTFYVVTTPQKNDQNRHYPDRAEPLIQFSNQDLYVWGETVPAGTPYVVFDRYAYDDGDNRPGEIWPAPRAAFSYGITQKGKIIVTNAYLCPKGYIAHNNYPRTAGCHPVESDPSWTPPPPTATPVPTEDPHPSDQHDDIFVVVDVDCDTDMLYVMGRFQGGAMWVQIGDEPRIGAVNDRFYAERVWDKKFIVHVWFNPDGNGDGDTEYYRFTRDPEQQCYVAPTPGPSVTPQPSTTPRPTVTPPTITPQPTATPPPTETTIPSDTPRPPTATPLPSWTPNPTNTPWNPPPTATDQPPTATPIPNPTDPYPGPTEESKCVYFPPEKVDMEAHAPGHTEEYVTVDVPEGNRKDCTGHVALVHAQQFKNRVWDHERPYDGTYVAGGCRLAVLYAGTHLLELREAEVILYKVPLIDDYIDEVVYKDLVAGRVDQQVREELDAHENPCQYSDYGDPGATTLSERYSKVLTYTGPAPYPSIPDIRSTGVSPERRESGGTQRYNAGEPVLGWDVNGHSSCYYPAAPTAGTVTDGVVWFWPGETRGLDRCP